MPSKLFATFYGPDNDFFQTAFFSSSVVDVTVLSSSSTQIVVEQPTSGAITTLTGTGLVFDSTGMVTGGRFTGMIFTQGSTTVATLTGFVWDAPSFASALDSLATGDWAPMGALFSAQPFAMDASSASVGLMLDGSAFTSKMQVRGSAQSDYVRTGSGNDRVLGGAGNDGLIGGAGRDRIAGQSGRDEILGGGGNDRLSGGGGSDAISGGKGNDVILGGSGRDLILGDAGRDILDGGNGNDLIRGGRGADTIAGGAGNDRMRGGGGNDSFIFHASFGNDRILDFQDGKDMFDVSALGIGFADISIAPASGGANTLITTPEGTITLVGVDSSLIDASDFIFV